MQHVTNCAYRGVVRRSDFITRLQVCFVFKSSLDICQSHRNNHDVIILFQVPVCLANNLIHSIIGTFCTELNVKSLNQQQTEYTTELKSESAKTVTGL